MDNIKLGNPAVVGLGGFGLTTLLLQFHNLGFSGLGPVVAMDKRPEIILVLRLLQLMVHSGLVL